MAVKMVGPAIFRFVLHCYLAEKTRAVWLRSVVQARNLYCSQSHRQACNQDLTQCQFHGQNRNLSLEWKQMKHHLLKVEKQFIVAPFVD